ncbi:MAG: dTDP-4-dehydrorhamnose reductase [Bacteroidetes bacterium]|nr:dTDP-4-dehydrorhamnose reductase [Bacteroidota bacterium]
MKKILVTGASGQLGSEIRFLSGGYSQYAFTYTDSAELDITDRAAVQKQAQENGYYAIINCAAYTAVDKAETDKEKAYLINATGAANLAAAAAATGAKFVHVSTDFIFDGTHSQPILEDDQPNPLSVYGASKLEGEVQVLKANPDTLLIRTSWVYSSYGANFVKTILRLCRERDSLNVIFDQIGTPTYARDLAAFILSALDTATEQKIGGVFHYSNEGVASWYDFAIAIRDIAGLKTKISPIETSQYPTPAVRPKYSVLNKGKIKKAFGIVIPYWRASLQNAMEIILKEQA